MRPIAVTAALCAAVLVGAVGLSGAEAMQADFYVAPQSSDQNAGSKEKPFATMLRARDAVRELRKGGLEAPVTVHLRGGTYWLTEPLVFGPEDGNSSYAAVQGEAPVLSGGRRISGWRREGDVWVTEIAEAKAGAWHFNELFVNGQRRSRARHPHGGYLRVEKAGPDNRTSFTFKPGDLKAYRNIGDAEIVFLHDWSVSRVPIAAVDEATNEVRLEHPIGAGLGFWVITGFEPHPRYFVENAPELLDAPGEWYLDRKTGVLTYRPMPDEDMTKAEVVAPVLQELLVVAGDVAKGAFVENLEFQGLTFAHCAFPRPAKGYAGVQAGFHEDREKKGRDRMPAAVRFVAARGCAFEAGRTEHVGGTALSLEAACADNRIIGNQVADCGGNGVMVGEPGKDPKTVARNNVVANNRIHHCGQTFFGCVGVWAGITDGTVIAHNEIAYLPYSGVSVGWQWNPEPTPCQKNVVEHNHIHHVMLILSDGGGIYTLGRQPGTVLRGNLIHDVPPNAGRAESNGMFIDEGSSEITIEENTIFAVARSPIRFHKATRDTVRKNTLVCAAGVPPFRFNATDEKTITFEDNTTPKPEDLPESWPAPRAPGRVGRALDCDGRTTFYAIPHQPALDPPQLTVEAWVFLTEYPDGEDPRRWIVNKNGNEWQPGHFALMIAGRDVGAYLTIEGGRGKQHEAFTQGGPLKLEYWHHLAMTYDGAVLKVYLDGEPVASKEINKPRVPGNTPIVIGRRQDAYNYFKGRIDEVRMYKRALSAQEIRAHFRGPTEPKESEGVVGHWSFEGEPRPPEFFLGVLDETGPEPAFRRPTN